MTNDIFSGNEIDGGEVKQINRGQNKQSEKGNLPQGTAIGTITIERDQLLSDLDCRNAHQGRNDVGEEKEAEQLLEQDAFLFPFPDTQAGKADDISAGRRKGLKGPSGQAMPLT